MALPQPLPDAGRGDALADEDGHAGEANAQPGGAAAGVGLTIDDVLALPSIPYAHRRRLPPTPGLYFAIADGREVVYIGLSTTSIRGRWLQHSRQASIRRRGDITIAYLEMDDIPALKTAERLAIRSIQPALNFNYVPGALDRAHQRDAEACTSPVCDWHDHARWPRKTA